MSGDLGPRVAFRACKALLKQNSDVRIILPVEPACMAEAHALLDRFSERVVLQEAGPSVLMSDPPRMALKERMQSSMAMCLAQHRDGHADGVLSVGNTGALLLFARRMLGSIEGVDRPALATQLPTRGKPLLMMDLGANVNMSSEQLLQLGHLARAWYIAGGHEEPSIGLLNIGSEPGKGTDTVRAADELLSCELPMNYVGFREGDRLFEGDLDAVICDGYSGNITLKTTEGLIEWLIDMMGAELRQSLSLRWFIPLWKATMRRIDRRVSPARHGGAMLLGVAGNVAKTHGKSDERTFRYALEYMVGQIRQRDYHQIEREIRLKTDA